MAENPLPAWLLCDLKRIDQWVLLNGTGGGGEWGGEKMTAVFVFKVAL